MTKLDTPVHNGEPLDVYFNESLLNCPALPLILDTYSELLKKDWSTFSLSFRNSSMVVWVENQQNTILGGICFDYVEERKEGWINLSFTDPNFRGRGINQLCHRYFENLCKKRGAHSIGSIVALDNTDRLKSALKVGFMPKYYRMNKNL
jgi:GNAT superfamily N-acetyltransferase